MEKKWPSYWGWDGGDPCRCLSFLLIPEAESVVSPVVEFILKSYSKLMLRITPFYNTEVG